MDKTSDAKALEQKERLLDRFHSPEAFVKLCKATGVYRGPESEEELRKLIVREVLGSYRQRLRSLQEAAVLEDALREHRPTLAEREMKPPELADEVAFAEAVVTAEETEIAKGIDGASVQVEVEMAYPVVNTLGQVVGYADIAGRIRVRGSWNPGRFLELSNVQPGLCELSIRALGMKSVWEDDVRAAVWVEVEIPSFYEFLKQLKGRLHYLNWHQEIPYRPIVVSPDERHRKRFAAEKIPFVTPDEVLQNPNP